MTAASRRVVIIDDDPQILDTAASLLRQSGIDVVTYAGRFNRLNAILEAAPDLVLLDVNMPFLSGDDLFGLFRDHPVLRTIPVVYFSANDETELRMLALQTGAHGYVSKSEMGLRFAQRVRRILDAVEPTAPAGVRTLPAWAME